LFFTSAMGAQLDADALTERARISAVVAGWYTDADLQRLLQPCSETGAPQGDRAQAVRDAAADVLSPRLGDALESSLVVAALLVSLGIVLAPARRRRRTAPAQRRMYGLDVGVVVLLSLIALAIAFSVAGVSHRRTTRSSRSALARRRWLPCGRGRRVASRSIRPAAHSCSVSGCGWLTASSGRGCCRCC
jgi:hypothetical protein